MPLNQALTSFKGKNVWIIGASSGIGEACAIALASRGANLILSARNIDKLTQLSSELETTHKIEAQAIQCDVGSQDSIDNAMTLIDSTRKSIDVLLFVSGVYQPVRADKFKMETAQTMIDVNLLGPMRVLSNILPRFIHQKSGHIAIVGSVAGYSGLPKSLVYGPTKAAIINLCEALYYDLKPHGISVHMISPGFVTTPATAKNDFKMPALISAKEAAEEICRGIEKGEFDIHFPKRFSRFLKLLRILPYPIYFWLLRTFVKI